jgi:hypothetical protein
MAVPSSHGRCLAPDAAAADVALRAEASLADTAGAWHRTWPKEAR